MWKDFITVVAPVLAIIVSFLSLLNVSVKDKSTLVIELTKELEKTRPNKHLVEFLFSKIYKYKRAISYASMRVLLTHDNPTRAVNSYLLVNKHFDAFDVLINNGSISVLYKNNWDNKWKRFFYFLLYCFLSLTCYAIAIFLAKNLIDTFYSPTSISADSLHNGYSILVYYFELSVSIIFPVFLSSGVYMFLIRAISITLISSSGESIQGRRS